MMKEAGCASRDLLEVNMETHTHTLSSPPPHPGIVIEIGENNYKTSSWTL